METDAFLRPSRAKIGGRLWFQRLALLCSIVIALTTAASAATRPHYGGTLRIMMQSAPNALEIPATPAPGEYWDLARTLSLIADTLVNIDEQDRPHPALAVAWESDASARHWQFTLLRGVKFHDGTVASPTAIAQILGAIHSNWVVRASADSISIDTETASPSLLAELALPRNLLIKRNANGLPVGTGPFLVAGWQPGKLLKLAADEESWAGRPFVDAIEIEFGKSLRDQAIALELDKTDVIEAAPQAANGTERRNASISLPTELLALVFARVSKAQDARLREALALAIDRKPIQSVLLKGAGEPAASILPNWMTGYTAVFSVLPNAQRALTLLAGLRQPALTLSYDPRDLQAQLIAERIALNAREVGITMQVSLSGTADLRLMRIVLPSPDPAVSLVEAASQMGSQLVNAPPNLDALYQSERSLLDGFVVIPLFHLPVATAASARVLGSEPERFGEWNWLSNVWLSGSRVKAARAEAASP